MTSQIFVDSTNCSSSVVHSVSECFVSIRQILFCVGGEHLLGLFTSIIKAACHFVFVGNNHLYTSIRWAPIGRLLCPFREVYLAQQ